MTIRYTYVDLSKGSFALSTVYADSTAPRITSNIYFCEGSNQRVRHSLLLLGPVLGPFRPGQDAWSGAFLAEEPLLCVPA